MYSFDDCAERLKAYRKENHITQKELAQLMGVNHITLRSWEQKQAKPPYHIWRLYKHLFNDSLMLPGF
ncbi:helix-turn-helix domain-containing protein [Lacrimispora amygdalina]